MHALSLAARIAAGSGGVALITFAAATAIGPLSVVGILVAQTGTMAVLLGLVLLGERPSRTQMAGIVLTPAAVTLLGAVS